MEKKHYVLNDLKTFKSLPYLKINLIILVLGLHLKHDRWTMLFFFITFNYLIWPQSHVSDNETSGGNLTPGIDGSSNCQYTGHK